MSIRINEKCTGCGRCEAVCPGTLIEMKNKRAQIKYPSDCWGCASCLKECRFGAIEFYLAPDIGGNGTYMQVKKEGKYLAWLFYRDGRKIREIKVDSTSSNKY